MEDKETIKPFWDDDKSKKISDKLPYFNEDEKPFEYKYYNGKLDNIIIKRKQPPKVNETLKDEVDDEIDFELFNDINSKLDSLIEADDKQWEIMNEKMAIIREKLDNILNKVSKNKKSKINKEENLFVLKTRKIRLYPTKEQKIILQKWFDGARTTYNNTVHYINTEVRAETQTIKELLNTTELEKKFVTKTSYFCEKCNKFIKKMLICKDCNTPAIPKINENLKKELEEIPSHIRQFSCKSVVTAFKSSLTNLKNGNISNFKIDFKAKKKIKHDSIDITHKDCPIMRDTVDNLYGFNFYPKKLGFVTIVKEGRKIRNKTLKRLPDKVDHDYKIYYDYITKKYFACIPVKQYIPKHKNTSTILSGDPGVRTFLTLYEREFVNSNKPIYRLCSAIQRNNEPLQFPNGSILLIQLTTNDCEKSMKLITDIFKIKYKYRNDLGDYYFEGNKQSMINDFIRINTDILTNIQSNNGYESPKSEIKESFIEKVSINKIIDDNDIDLFSKYINSNSYIKNSINEKLINLIAKLGRSEMIKIIINECNKFDYSEKTIDIACENGHLNILTTLHDNKLELKYSEDAIDLASANGHNLILDWFFKQYNKQNSKTKKNIKTGGETMFKYSERAIDLAAANGHTHILDWFFKHSNYYSQKVYYESYLQFKYTERAIDLAAANDHSSVITWFLNHASDEWLLKNSVINNTDSNQPKLEIKYSKNHSRT